MDVNTVVGLVGKSTAKSLELHLVSIISTTM